MKKKLSVVLAICMVILTLSACTTQQKAYLDELKKVSQWESYETASKGSIGFSFSLGETPETMSITFDGNGYNYAKKGQPIKGYATFSIKEKSGKFNIPEIKAYIDGNKAYISKSYIEEIMKSSGEEIPAAVKEVKAEYLLMDYEKGIMPQEVMGAMSSGYNRFMKQYTQALTDGTKRNEMIDKMAKIGDLIRFDIDVKQDGRTYTMALNSDELVDKSVASLDNTVKNMGKILEILELKKELGIDDSMIAELQKSYDNEAKAEIVKAVPELKETIKGSRVDIKEVFADDNYNGAVKFNLMVKDFGKFDMDYTTNSKKVAKKEIAMPKAENTISFEKYMELYLPPVKDTLTLNTKTNVLTSEKTGKSVTLKAATLEDGAKAYQFATFMQFVGIEYGYDKDVDMPYAMINGKKEHLALYEVNGVSYIEEWELGDLNIHSDFTDGNIHKLTVH